MKMRYMDLSKGTAKEASERMGDIVGINIPDLQVGEVRQDKNQVILLSFKCS
jgi:hypothetical protein